MNTLRNCFVATMLILFVSCTNDEDTLVDVDAEASDLVGTWELIEESQEGKGTATIEGIPITGNITSFAKDIDAQITISENPNTISASGGYTEVITGTFATISRTDEVPVSLNDEINQGSWSLTNGVLTLTGGGETLDINITELTATTLKVEIDVVRDVTIDGVVVAIDTTIKMTFSKS